MNAYSLPLLLSSGRLNETVSHLSTQNKVIVQPMKSATDSELPSSNVAATTSSKTTDKLSTISHASVDENYLLPSAVDARESTIYGLAVCIPFLVDTSVRPLWVKIVFLLEFIFSTFSSFVVFHICALFFVNIGHYILLCAFLFYVFCCATLIFTIRWLISNRNNQIHIQNNNLLKM